MTRPRIRLERGDLTEARVDAIVNAANPTLLGGGGVDGAIHRAAGPELLAACRAIPEIEPGVRCPTGEARITPGYRLPARYVIHTVGPVYGTTEDDAARLRSAHRTSLAIAEANGVRTIAFPAISCGVYGYPLDEAARVALTAVDVASSTLEEIRFVLFSDAALRAFERARDARADGR